MHYVKNKRYFSGFFVGSPAADGGVFEKPGQWTVDSGRLHH
jgi:hypothetical protein